MKRNVFYGALLVLLLGFLVRENRLIHIPKQVEKTEESAEWQPEWYEQMAEEINDSPITLEVDGTMVDPQLGSQNDFSAVSLKLLYLICQSVLTTH